MSLGPLELAMLAAIALLFFGPSKLPQLGRSFGDAIRGFKSAMNDVHDSKPDSPQANTSEKLVTPQTSDLTDSKIKDANKETIPHS